MCVYVCACACVRASVCVYVCKFACMCLHVCACIEKEREVLYCSISDEVWNIF